MWILLITAMHSSNPDDTPAKIYLEFDNQQQCEKVADSMTYEIKYKRYKLEPKCYLKK